MKAKSSPKTLEISIREIKIMASTCKPKLYYFNSPGRGEPIRQTLVYCNVDFEDVRFTGEEWAKQHKDQSPLGMSPFYEEGELKLGGSIAILRYVAEKNGLGGSNPVENAQLESYSDFLFDVSSKLYGIVMGPEDKRDDCRKEFMETVPKRLGFLENQVKSTNFLPADKVSYADIQLSASFHLFGLVGLGDVFKDCPKLTAIADTISKSPQLIEHREKTLKLPSK
ncbi:Glutathione S-transferase 1-like [Oopsacas minuta]|uniref:Glutathione S-transferase 1-like n=1 Tax=Oopsacas minuta TaxID=111878 RepID=A0AAV7K410_9METZ|nr:Glutathione S-transferase 1-like [Oopsacas minuta]